MFANFLSHLFNNFCFIPGTCYVGNKNLSTLAALVLVPQALYLTVGSALLLSGCLLILRKPRPSAAAPLTGAAPRKDSDLLGALCTLYVIPTACVLASVTYEYNNRDKWLANVEKPALWTFLVRHLMSLFVGVSTVFWIWSMRTVTAWRAVFRRLGPRKQPPVKCQPLPVLRYAPATHQAVPGTLSTSSRHSSSRSHSHRKPRVHQHRSGGETII